MSLAAPLVRRFRECFAADPRGYRAPGRVNLLGEHTDYNHGYVLPAAITFHTRVLAAPRADRRLRIHSTHFAETVDCSLDDPRPPASAWSRYVWGTARALLDGGFDIGGADLLVHGEVPLGAGLSSSASLEVAVARALLALAGEDFKPMDVAAACQRAENVYVGMRCGIMDQFAAACGRAGHALFLDCRSLDYTTVPLRGGAAADFRLVICNSMVHHQHAGGEYNRRREECERGVAALARIDPRVESLRDATADLLAEAEPHLDPVVHRRCRHILTENARVEAMAAALRNGDLPRCSELMAASHVSMRDDYDITCEEVDRLVVAAQGLAGVFGSRMTGGGFGGCTISLVLADAIDEFRRDLTARYTAATGLVPAIYVCEAADGAGRLDEESP